MPGLKRLRPRSYKGAEVSKGRKKTFVPEGAEEEDRADYEVGTSDEEADAEDPRYNPPSVEVVPEDQWCTEYASGSWSGPLIENACMLDASKELLRRNADVCYMLTLYEDRVFQKAMSERSVSAEAVQAAWDQCAGLRFALGDSSGEEGVIDCDSGQGPGQRHRYPPYFFKL